LGIPKGLSVLLEAKVVKLPVISAGSHAIPSPQQCDSGEFPTASPRMTDTEREGAALLCQAPILKAAQLLGADSTLSKPMTASQLLECIRTLDVEADS
jgi:hypothetical protein